MCESHVILIMRTPNAVAIMSHQILASPSPHHLCHLSISLRTLPDTFTATSTLWGFSSSDPARWLLGFAVVVVLIGAIIQNCWRKFVQRNDVESAIFFLERDKFKIRSNCHLLACGLRAVRLGSLFGQLHRPGILSLFIHVLRNVNETTQ